MGAVIMVQGTSSDAGKTILCTALCRALANVGLRVAPFKSQLITRNPLHYYSGAAMHVSWEQCLQAEACRIVPSAEMAPVLLEAVAGTSYRVIVNGHIVGIMDIVEYFAYQKTIVPLVMVALEELRRRFDVVVIEGSGSPIDKHQWGQALDNMQLAAAVDAPVVLISDIDRGGMFAYVAGTLAMLTEQERRRICGIIVNNFRGNRKLLQPGLDMLVDIINKPILGVLPHMDGLWLMPESVGFTEEATCKKREQSYQRLADVLLKQIDMDFIYNLLTQ